MPQGQTTETSIDRIAVVKPTTEAWTRVSAALGKSEQKTTHNCKPGLKISVFRDYMFVFAWRLWTDVEKTKQGKSYPEISCCLLYQAIYISFWKHWGGRWLDGSKSPSASIVCCIVATVAIGCRTMQISLNIISIGLSESHTGVRTVAISAVYKMYSVIRLTKMSETQWDLVDPKTPCTTYSHSKRSQASDMPEEIKGRWIRMSMKECRHWQEPSMIALADGQPLKRNIECTEVNCV